jgi:hypothetical protein
MKSLMQLRDDLKVQAHLFKAELKDHWQKLEKDLARLRQDSAPVEKAAKTSADDVKAATRELFDTVKKGYERIKESLRA